MRSAVVAMDDHHKSNNNPMMLCMFVCVCVCVLYGCVTGGRKHVRKLRDRAGPNGN